MRITCLKGGRIIDPINEVDEIKDLYIKGERIINIKDGLIESDQRKQL